MGYLHFQRSPLLLYDFFYFYILPISTDLFTERNSRILPSEISGLPNGNLPAECRQIFLDILFPFIVPEDDTFSTSDAKIPVPFSTAESPILLRLPASPPPKQASVGFLLHVPAESPAVPITEAILQTSYTVSPILCSSSGCRSSREFCAPARLKCAAHTHPCCSPHIPKSPPVTPAPVQHFSLWYSEKFSSQLLSSLHTAEKNFSCFYYIFVRFGQQVLSFIIFLCFSVIGILLPDPVFFTKDFPCFFRHTGLDLLAHHRLSATCVQAHRRIRGYHVAVA